MLTHDIVLVGGGAGLRGAIAAADLSRRLSIADDENFLKHSLAYRTPEGPRIEYSPVRITRWPPEKRKY